MTTCASISLVPCKRTGNWMQSLYKQITSHTSHTLNIEYLQRAVKFTKTLRIFNTKDLEILLTYKANTSVSADAFDLPFRTPAAGWEDSRRDRSTRSTAVDGDRHPSSGRRRLSPLSRGTRPNASLRQIFSISMRAPDPFLLFAGSRLLQIEKGLFRRRLSTWKFIRKAVFICLVGSVNLVMKFQETCFSAGWTPQNYST